MKRNLLIATGGLLALTLLWYVTSAKEGASADLFVPVKKGQFEVVVTATGELEAKNSVRITGPSSMESIGIWQTKISDLVAEGPRVKKGEYVALLDQTEVGGKLRERETELQKAQSEYIQTQLDTALTLRAARDELINLSFAMKEKDIVLEQSKYEPPATIRQAEIDKEKSSRAHQQAKENYVIKRKQAVAKMQKVGATLSQEQNRLQQIQNVMKEFRITAPEDGMVIYDRDWGGRKKTVGSQVQGWNPTVATLPDLAVMLSRTYVNEVDIRKIQKGQFVKIGLDAYPEKRLTGQVFKVANVGEQRPNSDAKVFEVGIQVNESDTTLRPAMTTSNNVIANVLKNVLFIPLESLHNQGDSLTYVFRKDGTNFTKQQVRIGQTNDNEAVILEGMKENDQVLLSVPKGAADQKLVLLPKPAKTAKSPALTVRK
ncbi:MAG: efflux RND transporter periplasmic adaptor subunit [Ferruginibacter sp.]|nr:efflux RND transporter periplasmic adaptor subunit [Cytophagales bacterium]